MTYETIVMPSAVTVAITALEAALPSLGQTCPVAGSVPNPRPSKFVRILRTGGVKATLVSDAAQITIEAWAPTDVESLDLAEACRAAIHALPGTVVGAVAIYRVDEFSGPQNLPDPISEQPRHVLTVQLHVRGQAV